MINMQLKTGAQIWQNNSKGKTKVKQEIAWELKGNDVERMLVMGTI